MSSEDKTIDFVLILMIVLVAAALVLHSILEEAKSRLTGPCPGCEAFAQEMEEEAAKSKEDTFH